MEATDHQTEAPQRRPDYHRAVRDDRPSRYRHLSYLTRPVAGLVLLIALGLVALALSTLPIGGCEKIKSVYGQCGGSSWSSVNGTGVLGEMLENAGHTVLSWRMLSPRLRRRADCIVWFANDFSPPSQDVCDWLEGWLRQERGRTLIYVGRDFDAAVWYWEHLLPNPPPDQKAEIYRRYAEAKRQLNLGLRSITGAEKCDWFAIQGGRKNREVRSLEGDPKWLEGVDPSKLEIELNHRMVPSQAAETTEVLLESKGDVLVARRRFDRSQLILVANGSFLLNLPLVNHEHRKLAGQLIDELGPPAQSVVFLETSPGGPRILDADPKGGPPSALAIFNVWPTNWILLHLAAVGILLCFVRFPIFGRPRDPEPEGLSDFGRHIQALGELLERSGDAEHAAARLAQFHQLVRADSAGPATRPAQATTTSTSGALLMHPQT
jgi:hypothetical protein